MAKAVVKSRSIKVTAGNAAAHERDVAVEMPVALVYDGTTQAVMMASPIDLEDFAVGFSLNEGIVSTPDEIENLEVIEHDSGIELRMWLGKGRGIDLASRRRRIIGPTGCGLCGVESLEAVGAGLPHVTSDMTFATADVEAAIASLPPAQELNRITHAVHGAGFWMPVQGLVAIAEDVGRHNALDKLVGRLRRTGVDATRGIIVLTSRVSIEMVQKAAMAGAPVIVAVSAPTSLALKTAETAGITLIAVARTDGFEIFTHAHRVGGTSVPKHGPSSKEPADHAA
jgi:FdhD protein